jgi:hypothetical protein
LGQRVQEKGVLAHSTTITYTSISSSTLCPKFILWCLQNDTRDTVRKMRRKTIYAKAKKSKREKNNNREG